MLRLFRMLAPLPEKEEHYQQMYDGTYIIPGGTETNPGEQEATEYDPTYWLDNGCFMEITYSHLYRPDLPSVLLGIPAELLGIKSRNEVDNMKRLKKILLSMKENTETFREIYAGDYRVPPLCEANPSEFAESGQDPVYWNSGVSYEFSVTNKLAQDCPTVRIGVPADEIGIEAPDYVVADFCLRELKPYLDELNDGLYNPSRPAEENGWYYFCEPGGEILVRNSAYFAIRQQKDYENGAGLNIYPYVGRDIPPKLYLCLLVQVQLPYHKMKKTLKMLTSDLPGVINSYIRNFDRKKLARVIELSEKQRAIRKYLAESDLCAFIANGSILPRSKGTDLPMRGGIPFESPPEAEIEICGVKGMGIRRGITVITGGGYSGKSTLIDAISAGIYDHFLGDGRELCLTDGSAVTISAEDGRAVSHVNISPFIQGIPGGDSFDFSTERASGSTSQAANIMEAIENGAKLLLIDEDRSATNFMIRDGMMRKLIKNEPITPFTERAKELAESGISTVLVIGGSGEYLSVADKVYLMEGFEPHDVTGESKSVCSEYGSKEYRAEPAEWSQARKYRARGFDSHPGGFGKERLGVLDLGIMMVGSEEIDLRGLHDIVTPRQLHALGFILRAIMAENAVNALTCGGAALDLEAKIDEVYRKIGEYGLDSVYTNIFSTVGRFFDLPRKAELWAVINRMRHITVEKA